MKREKNYKTAKFIEALEHIDPKYVEEAGKRIKERPMGQTVASMSRAKSLRQVFALVACVLLLSAVIPAVTYLVGHLPDILGSSNTTEQTAPETPPEETSSPAPETTVTETTIEETTSEETTSEPETTECTHSEYICTENMPTCTESAIIEYGCMLCGHSWSKTEPPLGHEFKDGVCTRCGEKEPITDGSQGLEYRIDGDHAVLVGIGTCTDKEIIVASTYNGLPVTSVDYSFSKISNVTSITLSDSVLTVGGIDNMPDLVKVYFSKSVEGINPESLIGCPNLVVIEVDKENQRYMSAGNCLIEKATKTIVHGCKGSVIPSDGSVTVIGEFSFHGCDWLTELTIPEGIERIDAYAFAGCDSLRRVILSDSLTYLGFGAFCLCESLESISLGNSLETLGGSVFEDCPKLMELTLPKTIKLLCGLAFFECKSLKKVSYEGTIAEWRAIEKTAMWSDGAAFTVIHCSDGDVNLIEYDGSQGLEYRIDGDHAVLVGIGTCTDKDIAVATKYNAFPVTEIDAYALYDCQFLELIAIPEGVTVIGNEAFYLCKNLKNVTLPSTLEYIQDWAFANCESLENIFIPDSVKWIGQRAFSDCAKLSSVTLGQGLEQIQGSAFHNCAALKSVRFPRGLKLIEADAFSGCTSLADIAYAGTVSEWNLVDSTGEGYYYQSFTWHKDVPAKKIRCSDGDVEIKSATPEYDGSQGLEYRIEGDHAVLVGIGTCTDKEIIVASTYNGLPVTAIGRKAIYSLDGITRVVISDTVTHLDYMAIAWCSDLESIHIPANLTTMEEKAIIAFGNIRSITVDPNNPNYYSVNNCLINRKTKTLILGCDTSIIPTDGSISAIEPKAFMMCDGIESITIPEGVTKIGEDAFYDCSALKSIELPESLITIDSSAFANCSSLQNVKLGGKVEYMGDYVFSECEKLGEIILPDSLSFLGNYAFQGCTDLKRAVLSSNLEILELMIFASCTNLEDVIIPEGVKTISTDAFSNTALKELKLPASIKAIRHGAFGYCDNLMNVSYAGTVTQWIAVEKDIGWHTVGTFKKIRCSDGEMKLYSDSKDEGSLGLEYEINTDGKSARLIGEGICTDAKIVVAAKIHGLPVTEIYSVALSNCDFIEEIVIPEGVTVIRNQAFSRCVNLKKITFPSTLEYIYDSAFADCESLVSIVIPREVKLIETWAFRDCKNLTKFTFAGTVAEWNAVQKGLGNNWNDGCPFSVIHCSDGEVEIQ